MRACVLILVMASAASADKAADDLAAMQGEWACDKMTRDGVVFPDDDAQSLFRTVVGKKYEVNKFRTKAGSGTFTIDATKMPREMDIIPDGPKKAVIKGIYRLEKGVLTMCYGTVGGDRPKAFEAKEGTRHTLAVWRKE